MFVATCAFRIDTGDVDTDLDDGFGQIVGIELGFGNFPFFEGAVCRGDDVFAYEGDGTWGGRFFVGFGELGCVGSGQA